MNAPAKGLLKAASILLIIFGAIATVILFIGVIVYAINVSAFGELAGIIIVTIILILAVSVLELILGIVGLKKYEDAAKGGFFIAAGMLLCAFSLAGLILSIAGSSFNVTSLGVPTGTLPSIGIVLPVLYIIGGFMNKKAASPTA